MTPRYSMLHIYCVSDRAIQIDWNSRPINSVTVAEALHKTTAGMSLPRFQCVQADRSTTLLFESAVFPEVLNDLRNGLITSLSRNEQQTTALAPNAKHHVLTVQYGGAAGPDLDWLAAQTGLSTQAVIDLHCSAAYTVQFLGFLPGFAYLSGLPGVLQFPRRSQPRARVPAGTLAVGAEYCAVYPWESPGGWHLIGYVEQPMFDPNRSDDIGQSLFQAGDVVQFIRADHA